MLLSRIVAYHTKFPCLFIKTFGFNIPQASYRNLSFLSGSNANYIEELFSEWKKDPNNVHKSWDLVFRASENGLNLKEYFVSSSQVALGTFQSPSFAHIAPSTSKTNKPTSIEEIIDQIAVDNLIRAYQDKGHHLANVDPFNGIFDSFKKTPSELTLAHWGLNESNLSKIYHISNKCFIGNSQKQMSLNEILTNLKTVYSSTIGVEISHIEDLEKVLFLRQKIEANIAILPKEDKIHLLSRIIKATVFENFLAKKFPAEKRFGVEGCESVISFLKDFIDSSAGLGVDTFMIGMAHRGRLNVLANVCGQPFKHIFSRFRDDLCLDEGGSSDVKYHLGLSRLQKNSKTQKDVTISVIANPSHLEAVNPVVKGRTKAEQFLRDDVNGEKVVCILIHGDSAVSGQGIVYETVNLSELQGYKVNGTIHVIINNQIGFTTEPQCSRTSRYCTDVAKTVQAPIFHVNADNPEAVSFVANIASEYRKKFKSDIFIDLIGYRKNGHNEGDNPAFTQPLMYKKIGKTSCVMDVYSKKLIDEGVISNSEVKEMIASFEKILEEGFSEAQKVKVLESKVWIDSPWKGFFKKEKSFVLKSTGFPLLQLTSYLEKCCQVPESFTLHPGLKRVLSQRLELLKNKKLDWALGEIALFSSLLSSGVHIRLSGQDSERGTFSHRHHILHDTEKECITYDPLNNLGIPNQAHYSVHNSPLSEYGVLGFEHGYSMASPNILTIWEGQFGDFANTAQCIIDQFISSGEDKWVRQSGIVMLLPHGYDGMGPEHSSARLERYLQLTKEDPDVFPSYPLDIFEVKHISDSNYIVANPTTPASLFHLVRRQFSFDFRKPLIIMSPKNLLRHDKARSSLSEFDEGTFFQRLISDSGPCSKNPSVVKRLIFCSGKVYYDLKKTRSEMGLDDKVSIARLEQISPFPFDKVSIEIAKYPNADIMFVQEEPKNQGAFYHVKPMISLCGNNRKTVQYSGRPVSVSPATGSKFQHDIEQRSLLQHAFKF